MTERSTENVTGMSDKDADGSSALERAAIASSIHTASAASASGFLPVDEAELTYLWKRRSDVRLRAMVNRLYQQERQARLEQREGLVKVASIVLSSVALSKVADAQFVQIAALIVFVASTMSLVLGWGNKSRDASRRHTEWAGLERDIEAVGERGFTETQVTAWFARANEIEATEPVANKVLLERAYLQACTILGVSPSTEGSVKAATWRPVIALP